MLAFTLLIGHVCSLVLALAPAGFTELPDTDCGYPCCRTFIRVVSFAPMSNLKCEELAAVLLRMVLIPTAPYNPCRVIAGMALRRQSAMRISSRRCAMRHRAAQGSTAMVGSRAACHRCAMRRCQEWSTITPTPTCTSGEHLPQLPLHVAEDAFTSSCHHNCPALSHHHQDYWHGSGGDSGKSRRLSLPE